MSLEERIQFYVEFLNLYKRNVCLFFLIDNRVYYMVNCSVCGKFHCHHKGMFFEYFRMYELSYVPTGADLLEMEDLKYCEEVVLLRDKEIVFQLMLEDINANRL